MMSHTFSYVLVILICKLANPLKISPCCENQIILCEEKFSKCTDFECSFSDYQRTESKSSLQLTSCSSLKNGDDGQQENYNFTFSSMGDGIMGLDLQTISILSAHENGNSFCIDGKRKIEELDLQKMKVLMVRICSAEDVIDLNAELQVDNDVDSDSFQDQEETTMKTILRYLYITLTLMAAAFVSMTIMSFLILHEKLNIHGWTQCTHALAFLLLLLSWLMGEVIDPPRETDLCKGLAIFDHFIYVSAYSWLVVVNFDLMKAFCDSPGNVQRHKDRKCWPIYVRYALFGWGVPGMIVLNSVGIEFTVGPNEKNTILPNYGYGDEPCTVDYIAWPYALLPNGILFLLVVIIIGNTIRVVLSRPLWFRTKSQNHHTQGTILIWRILLGMGTFWFLDILSLIYINLHRMDGSLDVWLHSLDFFVLFQAIPMFVIYVCRPESLNNLIEKFPKSRQFFECLAKIFCVELQRQEPAVELGRDCSRRLRAHRGSTDSAIR